MNTKIRIFQRYGIELEYMIVDKDTMVVKPITDELFKKVIGDYRNEIDRGIVTWSNELVLHVIELKSTKPESDLVNLANQFHQNIKQLNQSLATFNAKLLPSAAHPLMNPDKETILWPHGNNEIYSIYNVLFNCKGHGWANVQSTHLNLPFHDDAEFSKLHAAIRMVLPILPALSASSPIMDGRNTNYLDKRLDYYQKNQHAIPSITGKIIPEQAFSFKQYQKQIYDPIAHDMKPYDDQNILEPVWVNSRGAIARFDRGSIEIRLLDIQECPQADLAIISLIIAVLKLLVKGKFGSLKAQQQWEVDPLHQIFQSTVKTGENTKIQNKAFLNCFGINKSSVSAGELWIHLLGQVLKNDPSSINPWLPQLNLILNSGTLATRIIQSLNGTYTPENIKATYHKLGNCLENNEMFCV
ncbi:MAG: glutamate-cysteine ligase family protein [Cyclobacteriaceae bacterium]|jgi:glutamate---cysteine ligase / carboxylate-amine ligase|nr:glutamate-cysteine ligase family protein [Cyclobacteriaceae bacterium]